MINELYDYMDAGFRVFGLHGRAQDGRCTCGDADCAALYKHPRMSNWQSVPVWSDEQIETWEAIGHFSTGFGVLCAGHLVVDVDARNGGVDSWRKLKADMAIEDAAFVVRTGSGGGSEHHYFRLAESLPLVQKLEKYPGIDFKSSGFVVGAGSLHASGDRYDTRRGNPQDISEAPPSLLALLRKHDRYRVSTESGEIDVDEARIIELLGFVSPDCGYDRWIRVGMAIHHSLGGAGLALWDEWSAPGAKYPGASVLDKHWHSFGKSGSPVGFGTLLHYAREGGYCEPVDFVYQGDQDGQSAADGPAVADLKRPPGWVGELVAWINSQCLYPRENLAVAAALCAVSTIAGMRHKDEHDDIAPNLIAFCIAGSGTGKEAIQQAYLQILRAAGIQSAIYGGFKSEQELMRNLVRHQLAAYSIDEIGLVLKKLSNAGRNGASYLEGLLGQVMSVYSKATGYLPITGDLKEEIKAALIAEAGRVQKRVDSLPADSSAERDREKLQERIDGLRADLDRVDDGLDSPYLTIIGYTTPATFDGLMGVEQATNGFLARAILFQELETNPKRRAKFRKEPMGEGLQSAIQNLYAPGCFDMLAPRDGRIAHTGDKTPVSTTPEARTALDAAYDRFHALADEQKGATGLEAIPRRGYEMTAKISMLLAIPSGVRTVEHITWAESLAMRDCQSKIRLAYGTENAGKADGMAARILSLVDGDHGETEGVICNRLRSEPKEAVVALLAQMVERGMLRVEPGRNGAKRYFAKSG